MLLLFYKAYNYHCLTHHMNLAPTRQLEVALPVHLHPLDLSHLDRHCVLLSAEDQQ